MKQKSMFKKKKSPTVPPGMIGVPAVAWVWTEFMNVFHLLQRPLGTWDSISMGRATIAAKRNEIVKDFLSRAPLDWLLFLDSDMVPPLDVIYHLWGTGKPVVGALYMKRNPPFGPVAGYGKETQVPLLEFGGPNPVKQVDWVGTGCLMIRRRVLETVSAPWFVANPEGSGEDTDFCRKASAAGFDVYCDTSVHVGHLGVTSVDLEYAMTWNRAEQLRRMRQS